MIQGNICQRLSDWSKMNIPVVPASLVDLVFQKSTLINKTVIYNLFDPVSGFWAVLTSPFCRSFLDPVADVHIKSKSGCKANRFCWPLFVSVCTKAFEEDMKGNMTSTASHWARWLILPNLLSTMRVSMIVGNRRVHFRFSSLTFIVLIT